MKNNYYVIGGQYEVYFYGATETLLQAKRLATKNCEYWDNWQGWHTPCIYRAEDCEEIASKGMITVRDGTPIIVPKIGAYPCAYKDSEGWHTQD